MTNERTAVLEDETWKYVDMGCGCADWSCPRMADDNALCPNDESFVGDDYFDSDLNDAVAAELAAEYSPGGRWFEEDPKPAPSSK